MLDVIPFFVLFWKWRVLIVMDVSFQSEKYESISAHNTVWFQCLKMKLWLRSSIKIYLKIIFIKSIVMVQLSCFEFINK